jgi:hypothetical protein
MEQSDLTLNEDRRKYRKLRKLLRQIEHLHLASRELNDEEKLKLSKRKQYRKELNALTEKYVDSMPMLQDENPNQSFSNQVEEENTDIRCEEVTEENQFLSESNVEQVYQEAEKNSEFVETEKLENLSERADELPVSNLRLESQPNEEMKEEEATIEQKPVKSKKKSNKQTPVGQPIQPIQPVQPVRPVVNPVQAKKVPKPIAKPPKISFDTFSKSDAHRELIICTDICLETGYIATGRYELMIFD